MNFEIYGVALMPVIVALVALAKELGLPAKFAPLVSIGLGVAAILLFANVEWREAVFEGVICGLAASGLYSGGKSFVEAAQAKKLNGNGAAKTNGTKPPDDTTSPQP